MEGLLCGAICEREILSWKVFTSNLLVHAADHEQPEQSQLRMDIIIVAYIKTYLILHNKEFFTAGLLLYFYEVQSIVVKCYSAQTHGSYSQFENILRNDFSTKSMFKNSASSHSILSVYLQSEIISISYDG